MTYSGASAGGIRHMPKLTLTPPAVSASGAKPALSDPSDGGALTRGGCQPSSLLRSATPREPRRERDQQDEPEGDDKHQRRKGEACGSPTSCRGLRTEFRPFSRVLRLQSPASLCSQNSVTRTHEIERPKPRPSAFLMMTWRINGARNGAGWIGRVRLQPEPAPAVPCRAIARTKASAGRSGA